MARMSVTPRERNVAQAGTPSIPGVSLAAAQSRLRHVAATYAGSMFASSDRSVASSNACFPPSIAVPTLNRAASDASYVYAATPSPASITPAQPVIRRSHSSSEGTSKS